MYTAAVIGSNKTIITSYYQLLPIITPKNTRVGGRSPRPGVFEVDYYLLSQIITNYYHYDQYYYSLLTMSITTNYHVITMLLLPIIQVSNE